MADHISEYYIHSSWSNFEYFGVNPPTDSYKSYQPADLACKLFHAHEQHILQTHKTMSNVKNFKLKKTEEQLNKALKLAYSQLQTLHSTTSINVPSEIRALITQFAMGPQLKTYILDHLQFDIVRDTVKVVWKNNGLSIFSSDKLNKQTRNSLISHISLNQKSISITSLKAKIIQMTKAFRAQFGKQSSYVIALQQIFDKLDAIHAPNKIASNINKQASDKMPIGPKDPGRNIVNALNDFLDQFYTAQQIQQMIEWRFSELLTSIASKNIADLLNNTFSNEAMTKLLNTFEFTGAQSTPGEKRTITVISSPKFLPAKSSTIPKSSFTINDITIQDQTSVTVGGPTSRKSDIDFTINGETYGLSLKNTNFDLMLPETITGIKLQSSSLLLFLEGMKYGGSFTVSSYLNTLAAAGKKNANYFKTITQARKTLWLQALYSALSGAEQLRTEGFANILAVYDKNSQNTPQRIHLFSINDILQKYYDAVTEGTLKLPRNFSQLTIANIRIPGQNSSILSQQRISNILQTAHKKQLSLTLSAAAIKNLFK